MKIVGILSLKKVATYPSRSDKYIYNNVSTSPISNKSERGCSKNEHI